MTIELSRAADRTAKSFMERHAWKIMLGVSALLGLFGIGDMLGGAADLQKGETILMHSLTGMSWAELQAGSPGAANLIDAKFRTDGATLAVVAVLSGVICLTGFRRSQRWAWAALWAVPAWMGLTVVFVYRGIQYPGYGTPIPIISGAILFVLYGAALVLSARPFFQG